MLMNVGMNSHNPMSYSHTESESGPVKSEKSERSKKKRQEARPSSVRQHQTG